ncbi:MAG: hypothetical protein V1824_02610 [archaeon]
MNKTINNFERFIQKCVNIITFKYNWKDEINKDYNLFNTIIKLLITTLILYILNYFVLTIEKPIQYILLFLIISFVFGLICSILTYYFVDKISNQKKSKFKQLLNFMFSLFIVTNTISIIITLLHLFFLTTFGKSQIIIIAFQLLSLLLAIVIIISTADIIKAIYQLKTSVAVRNLVLAVLINIGIVTIVMTIGLLIFGMFFYTSYLNKPKTDFIYPASNPRINNYEYFTNFESKMSDEEKTFFENKILKITKTTTREEVIELIGAPIDIYTLTDKIIYTFNCPLVIEDKKCLLAINFKDDKIALIQWAKQDCFSYTMNFNNYPSPNVITENKNRIISYDNKTFYVCNKNESLLNLQNCNRFTGSVNSQGITITKVEKIVN